jgi:hypothetical protein
MFRTSVVDEMKTLENLRNDQRIVRRELRAERVKAFRCADQIDALTAGVVHLRRLKHKEHKSSQRIDRALMKLPDPPPESSARPRRRQTRAVNVSPPIEELTGRIESLRAKLDERPTEDESDEPQPPTPDPLCEFAKQLIDLMARIKLEKDRWTPNLHVSSIQLLVQSWDAQLSELYHDL